MPVGWTVISLSGACGDLPVPVGWTVISLSGACSGRHH